MPCTIRERFGVKIVLDYLLPEKLVSFAQEADRRLEFAKQLPYFQAAAWRIFNPYELSGYLMSPKPTQGGKLRPLLYVN